MGPRDHILGPADAPVTLVEYGDLECPDCARAHPIVEAVRGYMGDRLRFTFRHFPRNESHPHAIRAAMAAEAAGAQGRFWEMLPRLFAHQDALDDADLVGYAAAIGTDEDRVARELAEGTWRARVDEDFSSGVRSGVNRTPTFFINGRRHDGPWDTGSLIGALEDALPR
ncbi:MAG: DsbA family protein [Gemmatimonadota bacterium]